MLAEQKVIADKLDTLLAQVETTKARLQRIPPNHLQLPIPLLQIPQTLRKLPIPLHRNNLPRLRQQRFRQIPNPRPNLQHRILRPDIGIGDLPPQHTTIVEKILPKFLIGPNIVLL